MMRGRSGVQYVTDANGIAIGLPGSTQGLFDYTQSGQVLAAMDGTDGSLALISAGAGEAVSLDAATAGIKTVKCTLSTTAAQLFQADYTLTTPVYIGGFSSIQIPLYFTDMSATEISSMLVQIWLYGETSGLTVRPQLSMISQEPGRLCVESYSRDALAGGTTQATMCDEERISKVRIVITSGSSSVAKAPIYIGPIKVNNRRKKGSVLIYADGEYIEQNKYLLPLLDRYGLKANIALTNTNIVAGSGAQTTYMNEVSLAAAYANGHTLVHHTYGNFTNGWDNTTNYPNGADNGQTSVYNDIASGFSYLTSKGWTRGVGHCVNAFTEAFTATVANARQLAVSAALTQAGVKTCRVGSTYLGAQLTPVAHPNVNWRRFCGGIQITSGNTAIDVIAIIDGAAQRGEMGTILLHHPIVNTAAPASLSMTVADCVTWVEYLAAMVASGQVINNTIDAEYARLGGN